MCSSEPKATDKVPKELYDSFLFSQLSQQEDRPDKIFLV